MCVCAYVRQLNINDMSPIFFFFALSLHFGASGRHSSQLVVVVVVGKLRFINYSGDMHWCLNSLYRIRWNLGVCDMIELWQWQEKQNWKKKNVEFCRKHLITSIRVRKKPYSTRNINSSISSTKVVAVVAAANMECERVWHSIAMKISQEERKNV